MKYLFLTAFASLVACGSSFASDYACTDGLRGGLRAQAMFDDGPGGIDSLFLSYEGGGEVTREYVADSYEGYGNNRFELVVSILGEGQYRLHCQRIFARR